MFTPVDASYNNRSVYAASKSYKWLADTDNYLFMEDNELKYQAPGEKSNHTLLTLDQVNSIAKSSGFDEFKRIPNITWKDLNSGYFYKMNEDGSLTLNTINLSTKSMETVTSIPAEAENQTLNEATMCVAYTIGNDLYIANGKNKSESPRTPKT